VRLEITVDMRDLVLGDAIGDFLVQTGLGADDGYDGVSVEGM
jgi:hypothetical protein